MQKRATVTTPLEPHQQRVVDKARASGGVLVAHGLGSGKTLTSIAVADALGLPIEAVVPAPLIANYEKEMAKHLNSPIPHRIRSYEKAVRDKDLNTNSLVVMDEAHRARNPQTAIAQNISQEAAKAKTRLLLTGTPVYNSPVDLANLLNTAVGKKVLPDDPNEFNKAFIGQKELPVPLLTRMNSYLRGKPLGHPTKPVLINKDKLVDAAKGYVDVHKGLGKDFPSVKEETQNVTMSPKQWELYRFHEGKMPWRLQTKIRLGLPLSKAESKDLNHFGSALRQVSNTPKPYIDAMTSDQELQHIPKINRVIKNVLEAKNKDPNYRGIIYSNYLEGGLQPLSHALTKKNIPHQFFTGDVSKTKRQQYVKDYNEGRLPLMLLSGAGSEGLDLKGTKDIHILEPHWNESRLNQVQGRGIRYQSHNHLPIEERNVRVMRYHSTPPVSLLGKLVGSKPQQGIEQYLHEMSMNKQDMANQIGSALQEASDYGPLKTKTAAMTPLIKRALDRFFEQNATKDS